MRSRKVCPSSSSMARKGRPSCSPLAERTPVMADPQNQSLLKRDLAWHQRRILQQRQQRYQPPDEESYGPGYDDILPAEPDLLKFRHSDTGNAKRFLALHWGFVRYSPARKEWLTWNGHLWKFSNLQAYQLAAQAMILFTQQAGEN